MQFKINLDNIESAPSIPFLQPGGLNAAIDQAITHLLSQQSPAGYWWYTLEANESINAEFILLSHYLGIATPTLDHGIAQRIQSTQRADGSWPLYFGGPGDVSTTIECYLALKLSGMDIHAEPLKKAKYFILTNGGLTACRVFTRIHLALFGLISWNRCPAMPVSLIHLPMQSPINIYEFSSWARACIVPLLVILNQKKTHALPTDFLDELYLEQSPEEIDWSYRTNSNFLSMEQALIQIDKVLRLSGKFSLKPLKSSALKRCEAWIREHLEKTEDIYPALAYGLMALHSLGYPSSDPTIQKALKALERFQMPAQNDLSALPERAQTPDGPQAPGIYQQCCISPVWDTPWTGVSLLEGGVSPGNPALLKTGRWLISKQILNTYGDWAKKNKNSLPGGWSFEFENDYFPDIDDTVEVLMFLKKLALPESEVAQCMARGLQWVLSMQCKNGGWAAFDVDNDKEILNRLPFSDHGACLDPPTPDITGRTLEMLAQFGYKKDFKPVQKALNFIEKSQELWGGWWGRWGVNYIYGTWCVLQGLAATGIDPQNASVQKAVSWLKSVQHSDGGFGESCHSYDVKRFIALPVSVPSQTGWALMALVAAGEAKSLEAHKAAAFLVENQTAAGGWNEEHFTGTGFPGHFYIRYHGYRHYFPLLALSKYRNAIA